MGGEAKRRRADDHLLAAIDAALCRGLDRLAALQQPDGAWRGDYGGPMFLLPMYVALHHAAGRQIPAGIRRHMITHVRVAQNADGSIGLHAEGAGTVFTSTLSYVALRLLGVGAEDADLLRMRRWISAHGSALASASWGKLILALLGLYDYRGLNPLPPEVWLLPPRFFAHPSRLWCHCRQVYLPMAWLYGRRAQIPTDPLIQAIRAELYPRPYASIDWAAQRENTAASDARYPITFEARQLNRLLGLYERVCSRGLRRRALDDVYDHIRYEDRATAFIRIGPVNAVLNTFVHLFAGAEDDLARSFEALGGYLFDDGDEVKVNGYNSTALWDTVFSIQATVATPFADRYRSLLERAYRYVDRNQIREDLPQAERYYRHGCRGGWPFSDRDHGWPITDCTAEGLKAALLLRRLPSDPFAAQHIDDGRLEDAVDLLLSFQNAGGGWSTYEPQRGSVWLERLNPSGVFAEIMVDYPYVECTSAVIQALALARASLSVGASRVDDAIDRGARFIRREQRGDGSWRGSWAVCFTYGAFFAIHGLRAAGAGADDPAIVRAASFLLTRQNEDGGFGEAPESCIDGHPITAPSHPVQSAWALLALIAAGQGGGSAAEGIARYLIDAQLADGDWPDPRMLGVFNRTALIRYSNYRRYFPIWALGAYRRALTSPP